MLAQVVILQGTTEPHQPGERCYLSKSTGDHVSMFSMELTEKFYTETGYGEGGRERKRYDLSRLPCPKDHFAVKENNFT